MVSNTLVILLIKIGTAVVVAVVGASVLRKMLHLRSKYLLNLQRCIRFLLPDLIILAWALIVLLSVKLLDDYPPINSLVIVLAWYLTGLGALALRVILSEQRME